MSFPSREAGRHLPLGSGRMIRVGIVDDHPIVANGLRSSLATEADIVVAWAAGTLAEARTALAGPEPVDVVLLDVRLPDRSGLDLLPGTPQHQPAFLVLSSFDRPQYASAAFTRGAAGFLLKVAPTSQIVDAVRTAASGGLAFDARYLASLRTAPALSPRQAEIVRLIARGLSNEEIARILGLSRKTVEGYIRDLFNRYGFSSRTELALWAEREGWLDLPGGGVA
jgi:DNA-binding NarL/FixJ family response regulator